MPFKVGDAIIEVKPELITGFETALAGALSKPLIAATGGIGENLEELGAKLTTRVTLPLGAAAVAAEAQFAGLDNAVRQAVILFGDVGVAADRAWNQVRDGVAETSDDLGVFERDVASAVEQALSTEVPEDTVFQFVETATKAAVAGATELDVAVGGIATAVNTFSEQALTAEQAADIMFRGVVRGATTFEELSVYMNQVAPLAAAASVSFEELTAATATMTILGTPTRSAFTNIKSALTGMLRPTAELTEIFNNAGFATADMAIQQNGLAFAMDTVYAATQGQVGALIKLLGGAEAANAVLQITGTNADLFTSVLRDMESATGATNSAFEVMEDSAKHTFQELAVQADQLGSFGGDILFTVVEPLVKATTAVIDFGTNVFQQFTRLPAPIQAVGAGFFTLALTAGPFLSIMGRLLGSRTGGLLALSGVFKLLGTGGLIKTVVGGFASLLVPVSGMTKLLDPLTNQLIRAKKWGLEPLTTAFGGFARTAGLIGAGIGAAVVAFQLYEGWLERLESAQRVTTEGARTLAESLDLVAKPIEEMGLEDTEITIDFRAENSQLIQELQDADDRNLLSSRLVEIAFQLQVLGNTPEDIEKALETLTGAAGLTIPVDFSLEDSLDERTFGQAVERAFNTLDTTGGQRFEELSASFGINLLRGLNPAAREFGARLENLAEQVATLFRTDTAEGINEAFRLLEYFNDGLGDGSAAADYFGDSLVKALDIRGEVGFTTSGIQSLDARLSELREKLNLEPVIEMDPFEDNLSRGRGSVYEFIATLDEMETAVINQEAAAAAEEALDVAREAGDRLTGVMRQANDDIRGVFTTIRDEIRGQIPLFGEYAGAADLNLDDILESLETFATDTAAWTDLSVELFRDIPEGLRDQLNQMPLDQRAALAQLEQEAPGEFATWLAEVEAAWDVADSSARDLWKVKLPGLVKEGNALVLAEAQAITQEMGTAGDAAADAWGTEFASKAAEWAAIVARYSNEAINTVYSTLEMTSPSKVFMRAGKGAGEGFIVGLESTFDPTMRAVQGLYSSAGSARPEEVAFGAGGAPIGAPKVNDAEYEQMGREVARALGRGLRDEAAVVAGGVRVTRSARIGPDPSDVRSTRLLEDLSRLPL